MRCAPSLLYVAYVECVLGIVFEGFDRAGQLRAICGGGRYDKLLGTFGGEDQPCAGFGFGDAVIVELLKDRGLLAAPQHQVRALLPPQKGLLQQHEACVVSCGWLDLSILHVVFGALRI